MTRRRGTTRLLLLVLFSLLMFCSPGRSIGCVALPFVILGWLTELTTGRGAELAVIKLRRSERPFMLTVTVRALDLIDFGQHLKCLVDDGLNYFVF
jgi:hypothetical protein